MGVEFHEENNFNRNFGEPSTPKIAGWIIAKGWAKDVEGANKLQIIAAIVFFALAIFFAF